MFLLVPAYPGCPGSKAVKRSLLLLLLLYVSLIMRGSSMLHESETWPVRKENLVALQRVEMRMVRCGVKLKDRLPSKELRERD